MCRTPIMALVAPTLHLLPLSCLFDLFDSIDMGNYCPNATLFIALVAQYPQSPLVVIGEVVTNLLVLGLIKFGNLDRVALKDWRFWRH